MTDLPLEVASPHVHLLIPDCLRELAIFELLQEFQKLEALGHSHGCSFIQLIHNVVDQKHRELVVWTFSGRADPSMRAIFKFRMGGQTTMIRGGKIALMVSWRRGTEMLLEHVSTRLSNCRDPLRTALNAVVLSSHA